MTTPDLRPIGALTPEILSTASHWCLLHGTGASVHESKELHIDPRGIYIRVLADEDVWPGGSYMRIMHNAKHACYPCTLQPNGLVVPEPWPVLDGEEEIEEWSVFAATWQGQAQIAHSLQSTSEGFILGWTMQVIDEYNDVIAESPHVARPNMHPAPRKGKLGPVWVWEADKC